MKLETIQKIHNLNEVHTVDEVGPGGAHHHYMIKEAKDNESKANFHCEIKFQKGQQLWTKKTANGLYGGYYLSVNGRVLEDYMGELPTCWDVLKECQPNNLFIWAYSPYTDELGSLGIIFYDQRKRHFGGKGITGGYIQLLSPTKIRWKLDELTGIWNETEGDESISDAERRPIGFSVPDDVIMTKE